MWMALGRKLSQFTNMPVWKQSLIQTLLIQLISSDNYLNTQNMHLRVLPKIAEVYMQLLKNFRSIPCLRIEMNVMFSFTIWQSPFIAARVNYIR